MRMSPKYGDMAFSASFLDGGFFMDRRWKMIGFNGDLMINNGYVMGMCWLIAGDYGR